MPVPLPRADAIRFTLAYIHAAALGGLHAPPPLLRSVHRVSTWFAVFVAMTAKRESRLRGSGCAHSSRGRDAVLFEHPPHIHVGDGAVTLPTVSLPVS